MEYDATNKIIKIKKSMKTLIWLQLYFTAIFGCLRDIVGMPGAITYCLDILLIMMTLYTFFKMRFLGKHSKVYYALLGMIILFFIITIIGFILNGYSFLLYIWGFRITFRFYIFFFLCAIYFEAEDLKKMMAFIKHLFYLNVIMATIEFLLGFRGDYIGGTFGVQSGGNGDLNTLMIIITSVVVVQYLSKNIKIIELGIIIFGCLYLMAIAELKVYVFELPFIFVVAMLNERFTLRKVGVIGLVIVGLGIGIAMLGYFFPNSGFDFFTSDAINQYMGNDGYTGQGDFSRFNAVIRSKELFFDNDFILLLFGLGLGNCSYSGFSFLTSEFYNLFQNLHYQWFTDSMIFLETGWLGLIIFEAFFISLFLVSIRYRKKFKSNTIEYISVKYVTILSLCCIILSIYNISLKMEIAYLLYAFMAAILVAVKELNINNSLNSQFYKEQ